MKRLNLALLVVENNDYQAEQTISAKQAAHECEADLQVIQTEHDAVVQSQQVLKLLYSPEGTRPNGIFFEPVGTPLAQPAKIAASSGVGWVVLNREVDYLGELRRQYPATPIFCITTNHEEVGRIQGEQIVHLLPQGGGVLYIQGPSDNKAAVRRAAAMQAAKPAKADVRVLKGLWTEESAYNAVGSWLKLNVAKDVAFGLVAGQNDAMALGARRAFQELTTGAEQERWLSLPYIGCDGLRNTGQAYVHRGLLAATIVIPANAGQAIKAMVTSLRTGEQPPECIFTSASSFPNIASLKPQN
ncbi:MAG TPA: substrate-binding domain-containing protein [Verrucomicrobiae bacterium]|nr:substrate-binding domain-containing protein [Verrucomicrobiae bacterium]